MTAIYPTMTPWMATRDPVLGVKGQMVGARPDGGLRPTKGRPPLEPLFRLRRNSGRQAKTAGGSMGLPSTASSSPTASSRRFLF